MDSSAVASRRLRSGAAQRGMHARSILTVQNMTPAVVNTFVVTSDLDTKCQSCANIDLDPERMGCGTTR